MTEVTIINLTITLSDDIYRDISIADDIYQNLTLGFFYISIYNVM
jgi:predicted CopG family antitoxin